VHHRQASSGTESSTRRGTRVVPRRLSGFGWITIAALGKNLIPARGASGRPPTHRGLAPVYHLDHARLRKVSTHRFGHAELAETAAGLQRLLAAIEAGEVTADAGTVARLEGAISGSQSAAGNPENQGLYQDDRLGSITFASGSGRKLPKPPESNQGSECMTLDIARSTLGLLLALTPSWSQCWPDTVPCPSPLTAKVISIRMPSRRFYRSSTRRRLKRSQRESNPRSQNGKRSKPV
jgi:hypothetical protein